MESDDSFAWSNASTSSSSDNSNNRGTMSELELDKNHVFKKETEAEVKRELMNGKVKEESESQKYDFPTSPAPLPASRKRKRETEHSTSQDSEPDLHLLEKRVKRERAVSHFHKESYNNNNETCNNELSQEFEDSLNSSKTVTQKKKSKRKSENLNICNDETDMVIEDKFEAEESFVASRPKSRLSNKHLQESEHVSDTDTPHKSKKAKKKKHKEHSKNSQNESEFVDSGEIDHNDSLSNVDNDTLDNELTEQTNTSALHHTATKISDRIQFEDEVQIEREHSELADTHSSKLQRFLKANLHLQSITETKTQKRSLNLKRSRAALSQNEDIWLINCPQDIDISSLKGVDISLDTKCKLKTNSQTYIGNIQNENSSIPIFMYEHKKPVVKNIIVNGIVNFRKRIPKAHYIDDNVINNHSDFIPLPETKNRHPLFGPDYKKAIKIPSTVKARLKHSSVTSNPVLVERKKKKKNKIELKEESLDNSSLIEREEEVDGGGESASGGRGGGERKRRRNTPDDTQPRKKKKKVIKQEVSVGSWDSEKAIEENLFNF